jgi:photosystem II stability/assembly factor-like uncharacterized protein
MSVQRAFCSIALFVFLFSNCVFFPTSSKAQDVRHVSAQVPVIGPSRQLAAQRPAETGPVAPAEAVSPTAHNWKLLATIPGAVIHDISFPTEWVGYAAAELGQVWKTTDGGATWTEVMNLGFPYYWYGVATLSTSDEDVVVSGFNDNTFQGIIRWSHDGGSTWSDDIVLTATGWSDRIRFASPTDGLVVDQLSIGKNQPNMAHYTTAGGTKGHDWKANVPDKNGGWFGNQFSLLPSLQVNMSGITYCTSVNGGAKWTCGPSIDSVFDGPTFFLNRNDGWVGGGEISPNVEGWLHRTTDGGKTWSGRVLNTPWPVREIWFLTPYVGWAAGGNYSQNVGGMYFSNDGGQTWSLDVSTGSEMGSCDSWANANGSNRVWCAGYDGSFNGVIYFLNIATK